MTSSGVLAFMHTIQRLKTTRRTGWVERGIRDPESISDHMHRMGILSMLVNDPTLDSQRFARTIN